MTAAPKQILRGSGTVQGICRPWHGLPGYLFQLNVQNRDMKRCNDCRTFAAEDSPYCRTCGSSFGLKLCPKGHANPPSAHFCGTCGSGDLSRPHRLKPRHDMPLIVIALALAVLLALGIAVILAWG